MASGHGLLEASLHQNPQCLFFLLNQEGVQKLILLGFGHGFVFYLVADEPELMGEHLAELLHPVLLPTY